MSDSENVEEKHTDDEGDTEDEGEEEEEEEEKSTSKKEESNGEGVSISSEEVLDDVTDDEIKTGLLTSQQETVMVPHSGVFKCCSRIKAGSELSVFTIGAIIECIGWCLYVVVFLIIVVQVKWVTHEHFWACFLWLAAGYAAPAVVGGAFFFLCYFSLVTCLKKHRKQRVLNVLGAINKGLDEAFKTDSVSYESMDDREDGETENRGGVTLFSMFCGCMGQGLTCLPLMIWFTLIFGGLISIGIAQGPFWLFLWQGPINKVLVEKSDYKTTMYLVLMAGSLILRTISLVLCTVFLITSNGLFYCVRRREDNL